MDSVSLGVYFPKGYSTILPDYKDNGPHILEFVSRVKSLQQDPSKQICSISITSSASPDGISTANAALSLKRGIKIKDYLMPRLGISEDRYKLISLGVDWDGLAAAVEASDFPDRQSVVKILRETPLYVKRNGVIVSGRKKQLMDLNGGRTYKYLSDKIFPDLRDCRIDVCVIYETETETVPVPDRDSSHAVTPSVTAGVLPQKPVSDSAFSSVSIPDTAAAPVSSVDENTGGTVQPEEEKIIAPKLKIAFKTNGMYDLLLVPNAGVEIFTGNEKWSFGANWMYAWWSSDKVYYYWRTYGGDAFARRWFGRHHFGVYAQMVTYDFELGGKGFLGDRWTYGAGLEYGYNIPLTRRLSLDFTLGLGYLGGQYKVYHPETMLYPAGVHYVWEKTLRANWFGPTNAEISLVWYLWDRNTINHKNRRK